MPTLSYDTQAGLATDNHLGANFMDHLLPTAVECPSWATVGSPAAVVNAVLDALKPYRVRHADMPLTLAAVWSAIQGHPLRTDLGIT